MVDVEMEETISGVICDNICIRIYRIKNRIVMYK